MKVHAGDVAVGKDITWKGIKYKVIRHQKKDYDIIVREYNRDGILYNYEIKFNGYTPVEVLS